MRLLTDGVHWRGIGGPDDFTNIERSVFASNVRKEYDQRGASAFFKQKGAAATRRCEGVSGWHLYNVTLPSIVDGPPEEPLTPTDAAESSTAPPPVEDDEDEDDSD